MSGIQRSQRTGANRSIREKRSEVKSNNMGENRSLYGGSRHYQRGDNSRATESIRTQSSAFTYNGQTPSVFIQNLKRVGEVDNRKANLMWNNYLNSYQKQMENKKNVDS